MFNPSMKWSITYHIMMELFPDFNEDDYEFIMVKAYITAILNASKCPQDLIILMPTQLHHTFMDELLKESDSFFMSRSLSDAQVVAFKEAHKDLNKIFKERLLFNLLTE